MGDLVEFSGGSQGVLVWEGEEAWYAVALGPVEHGEGALLGVRAGVGGAREGGARDFLGRTQASPLSRAVQALPAAPPGAPLVNEPVPVEGRQPIHENLHTGFKALDALAPVGRGQSTLLLGAPRAQAAVRRTLRRNLLSSVGGGAGEVRCIVVDTRRAAAVGETEEGEEEAGAGGEGGTSALVEARGRCPGEQLLAVSAGCALGEATRDAGGHSLVVVDGLEGVYQSWLAIQRLETELTAQAIDALSASRPEGESQEDLVEVNGMLVSAVAAKRRRFFSAILQRAAKLAASDEGAGTMTLIPIVSGRPADGRASSARAALDRPGLSEDLRRKLEAKLGAAAPGAENAGMSGAGQAGGGSSLPMEVVEELMSIADGHCDATWDGAAGTFSLNPSGTLTRVGSGRTSDPALLQFSNLRLELAQDSDAESFGVQDAVTQQRAQRAALVRAFLEQEEGAELASVEKLSCGLRVLLERDELLRVPPSRVRSVVDTLYADLLETAPDLVRALGTGAPEDEDLRPLASALERALAVAL